MQASYTKAWGLEGFDVNFEIQTNNKGCSIHGSLFGITAKVRGELEPNFVEFNRPQRVEDSKKF